MTRKSKDVVALLAVLCPLFVILIKTHFVAAAFHGYRFNSYVHVRLDVPACINRYPGTGKSECCQCVLAFEGQKNPSGLSFTGSSLKSRYDSEQRTYISGDGIVTDGKNTVELHDGKIFLNKQEIPVRSTPMKVLLTKSGELENQFFD